MPRLEKDAFDWSLTFSPETDCKSIPGWFSKLIESKFVTHALAITERHTEDDKWHIHIAFRCKRSYKSDYKWWAKLTDAKAPELDIHYHNQLAGLAGGYLSKSENGNVELLLNCGFSDEILELGKEFYVKGQMRARIRKYGEGVVGIHPNKLNAYIGAICAETGCAVEDAPAMLSQLGFSTPGDKEVQSAMHKSVYLSFQRGQAL